MLDIEKNQKILDVQTNSNENTKVRNDDLTVNENEITSKENAKNAFSLFLGSIYFILVVSFT